MSQYVVWASGEDRPGIVAAVTGALVDLQANLSDCSMTRLANQFAMVLVVTTPLSENELRSGLGKLSASHDIVAAVRPAGNAPRSEDAPTFVIAVYGSDRPGIVRDVATFLGDRSINITDLETRVIGDDVYTMLMEVSVPETLSSLEDELQILSDEIGVEITIHELESDVL